MARTGFNAVPRVALFADSYHEANGVARTMRSLADYAKRRRFPLLVVHAGDRTRTVENGTVVRVELRRGAASFRLEHDLRFDLAMWRHAGQVAAALREFKPDVLHFTGPSDIGQLGAFLGHRLGIPIVGSWHTNLHEYAARRLHLRCVPDPLRQRLQRWAERQALRSALLFYKIPRVVLAPNSDIATMLRIANRKPTFLMSRGVDSQTFTPSRRRRTDATLNIGYVGRLSPEKSVQILPRLEAALVAAGCDVRFTIVGEGTERASLERLMQRATFTGVLLGEALAAAYADMDLFAFPSQTETVGNVVLEAMASGVPVVAMAQGGPRFVVGESAGAVLAANHQAFISLARSLAIDAAKRDAMRGAARQHALELSWDRIFDGVYCAYRVASAGTSTGRNAHAIESMVVISEEQPSA